MPTPPTKSKKFESLAKFLQKKFKTVPVPPERSVIDHLLYAAVLENAPFEQADIAFETLKGYFIDWNEMRVALPNELADLFPQLPDAAAAGERIHLCLRGVFDKNYTFDLEEWKKKGKNLSQFQTFLESLRGITPFMIAYTAQAALDGHIIPLDEAALRIFRLLDLSKVNKEETKEEVSSLERAITKKEGTRFSAQLHHFAAGYFDDPESAELQALLKAIDFESVKRSWIPPALKQPKNEKKEKPKPAFKAGLPFHYDEDEYSDDSGDDVIVIEEEVSVETETKKPKGKEKGGKKDSKTGKRPPQSAEKPVEKPFVKSTVKPAATVKPKPEKGKNSTPQKTAAPVKNSKSKTVPAKPAPKQPVKQTPSKPAGKSVTRQLREKKPK
jgi:endonuclease-3